MSSSDTEEADAVHHRILQMRSNNAKRGSEVDEGIKGNRDRGSPNEDIKLKKKETVSSSSTSKRDYSQSGDVEIPVTLPQEPKTKNQSSPEDERFGFDFVFFRRFYRLHSFLFLSWTSMSTFLFAFLLCIILLQEYIVYRVGLIPSGFYKVLAERDLSGFWVQTWISLAIILAVAFVKSTNQYVQKVLTVTWRQLLCRAVHRLYFAEIRFYQLNVLDKSIDNPDQRMTQDIDKFCTTYCEVLPKLMISPFVISYYCYQAYERSGWQGPLGCFGFFIIFTLVNKLLMTPIIRYVVKQEKCEGDFRFIHMLVRVNSESIAFHNASHIEGNKANESIDRLITTQHRLYCLQFPLNFSTNLSDYVGSIFSYWILAISIFSGQYDDLTPSELSALISQNAFVLIYLIYTFTSLVDVSAKFTDIAGVGHRIAQLMEKLNTLGDFWKDLFPDGDDDLRTESTLLLFDDWTKRRKENESNGNKNYQHSSNRPLLPTWILRNVTFSAPTRTEPLVSKLNLTLSVGESVLIVGNSSAGKSSLLRLLRGLWPHSEGVVKKLYPPGPESVFYCPQKPYLTYGTLREQIYFPLRSIQSSPQETNLIIHYISLLKLTSLLERIGGLDVPVSWNLLDSLSPGEMQRLCFIRLFYHRPLIAVLDEATSALPLEMEDLVYSECHRLGITTISVGHRASLRKYHDKLLTLNSNGGWTIEPLISNQKYLFHSEILDA